VRPRHDIAAHELRLAPPFPVFGGLLSSASSASFKSRSKVSESPSGRIYRAVDICGIGLPVADRDPHRASPAPCGARQRRPPQPTARWRRSQCAPALAACGRFNAVFAEVYARPPTEIRKRAGAGSAGRRLLQTAKLKGHANVRTPECAHVPHSEFLGPNNYSNRDPTTGLRAAGATNEPPCCPNVSGATTGTTTTRTRMRS
jgi:hypothetical protein